MGSGKPSWRTWQLAGHQVLSLDLALLETQLSGCSCPSPTTYLPVFCAAITGHHSQFSERSASSLASTALHLLAPLPFIGKTLIQPSKPRSVVISSLINPFPGIQFYFQFLTHTSLARTVVICLHICLPLQFVSSFDSGTILSLSLHSWCQT